MSTVVQSNIVSLGGYLSRGVQLAKASVSSIADSVRAARLMEDLFSMSDRELADIGIKRSEIDAFVEKACKRK